MTQKCYPLNDVDYDSEDVQLYHAGRTTGIFNVTGDDLKVSYVSGMNVSVTPGTAYLLTDVNGFGGFTYANTASVTLTVDTASSNTRYDYIAVRYTKATNSCQLAYIRGDMSMPKACVRTSSIYEIIVAIIQVPGNAASLSKTCIIDTRLNETFCGLVTDGTNKLPTQPMYDQYNALLAELEKALDGNTAGNLLNQIKANKGLIDGVTKRVATNEGNITTHGKSINDNTKDITEVSKRVKSIEDKVPSLEKADASLSNRIAECEKFKWKVGTSTPTTSTCPSGYFYFQLEG